MPDELTDEAKAEIAAAIAIVREDRLEKFLRSRFTPKPDDPKPDPKNDPPKPDPKDPPKPTDPPASPDPKNPPNPAGDPPSDTPKKRGLWWGDSAEE